jgi:hypothetical protein
VSVVLRPLISLAGGLFDRLWHERMCNPVAVLLPDWADPALPDPVAGAPTEGEAPLRARLIAIATQLRELDPAAAARDALRSGIAPDLRTALLALPGCAPWTIVDTGLARRTAADGSTYVLMSVPGEGAAHAEHAALVLRQTLWLLPPPSETPTAAPTTEITAEPLTEIAASCCLSLACALRDVTWMLLQAGEVALAAEVAEAAQLQAALRLVPIPALAA